MMNASEARACAIAVNCYEETVNYHLYKIEKSIKAVAGAGGMSTVYANDIKNVSSKVKDAISAALSKAGYKVTWGTNQAYFSISWRE